jgi:hypothetical protein
MKMRLKLGTAALVLACLSSTAADAGTIWTWGARISSPQLVSVSGGVLIGRTDAPPRPPTPPDTPAPKQKMHIPTGLLLQVEPGVGGGRVGLGLAKGLPPVAAGGIQAFYLRTWGQPLWNEKGRSYVGVQLDATLFMKLSIGVMRRVNSEVKDTKITGGIGVGF